MGKRIEDYKHNNSGRLNNPDVGLVNSTNDSDSSKKRYLFDPHIDPELQFDSSRAEVEKLLNEALSSDSIDEIKGYLSKLQKMQDPFLNWAGKAERTSFDVPVVSLHIHERISPGSVLNSITTSTVEYSHGLFGEIEKRPLREAIQFYKHKQNWKNRLIAGDSLLVMNSLIQKEAMSGQVQMVYIDPPYGIKYGSNFQPFVGKRDVKDGKDEDLTSEPEQIKAFRDTWELGIHSYLSYLRDRLLLARDLLAETGSCFVQISDENVHLVRNLMDEVFGKENFISLVSFRTKIPLNAINLPNIADYIVWYSKNKNVYKYFKIFENRSIGQDTQFTNLEEYTLNRRKLNEAEYANLESIPANSRIFRITDLIASGHGDSCHFEFELNGRKYFPTGVNSWKTNQIGLYRAIKANRIYGQSRTPGYIFYSDDYPVMQITNQWLDTQGATNKIYSVQTAEKVIERCILMTTDPGDLVLDITCGSGTTAFCAEKWGRRWITCDTSRVALAIARQRLTTAMFDYYTLKDDKLGVDSGFFYKTVPHITLKSIANNEEIDRIWDKWHPDIEKTLSDLNNTFTKSSFKPIPLNSKGEVSKGEAGVSELKEWEVPFELPMDWPKDTVEPFERFRKLKRDMQVEMDASIARRADQETLYDQPLIDKTKVRVTGPFTVEAVPAPTVQSLDETEPNDQKDLDNGLAREGESLRMKEWTDELLKTGIKGKSGQKFELASIELTPYKHIHATGQTKGDESKKVAFSFGPEHMPLEQKQVELALEEAHTIFPKPSIVVFTAFQFDPEAAKDIDEEDPARCGFQVLKASMNPDLQTEDLKKKRSSNESFWLVGSPDVELIKQEDGEYRVEVLGFDYYDMVKGTIESGGKNNIACWMLDTDYDGRSIIPRQIFFPLTGEDSAWAKLKKTLKAELNQEKMQSFFGTVSNPFVPGDRIAIKIIDDRGLESLKIIDCNER
ncbi:MAG: Modification methylase DpnIIB [bacterium ADurb.Bin132]|nr:MAG: Modification methylase DpnIIB [bacterium ADurb.Bin132]